MTFQEAVHFISNSHLLLNSTDHKRAYKSENITF